MFNFKAIIVGAAAGAGASYLVKVDMKKGAMIGALVGVAGPLVDMLYNRVTSAAGAAAVAPGAPK